MVLAVVVFKLLGWAFRPLWETSPSRHAGPARRRGPEMGNVRIEDDLLGHPLEVRFDRDLEGGVVYTRVVVDLRGQSPGMLKIAPPGWASRIARMFGNQDITVGDPAFDDHFVIMAKPESLAHRVFAPERRARVTAAVRRIGLQWAPFIDLTAEKLSVGVVAHLRSQRAIVDLLATAREFVEVLREIGSTTGIVWVGETTTSPGQCQVCGAELVSEVVYCASCRTPHHEECWRYTGECSTFACREQRFSR